MSQPQPTRAEIYERIKATSKQEVILAEMQRLGFWPKSDGQPQPAAELIQRESELQRELHALKAQLAGREDPERALKLLRTARMKAALERREETKRQRAQQRYDKALAWQEQRKTQIGYLGAGVSGALHSAEALPGKAQDKQVDMARLAQHGLAAIDNAAQLAQAMGISVAELRFLSFHREVSRSHHYHSFTLPKKTGGERLISAPMPRLKRAQYWVLDNVLARVPAHAAAHGFLAGRSIITNAQPHAGCDVVINLDVKDFFPSIAFARIKGVFRQLGYSERMAAIFALLCSENRAQAWQVDGEKLYVGGKARERVLPQGAPTSPMLTNLLCRRMDRRLLGLAKQLGFTYTRYADDLTFSASGEAAQQHVGKLLRRVRWILRDEGFTPHPEKERVMRKGRRQEVTGLVVNGAAPSVSRQTRRRLRAALHHASRGKATGNSAPHWAGQPAQPSQLQGLAHFVHHVNAAQGKSLLHAAQLLALPPVDRINAELQAASQSDREEKVLRAAAPASKAFRRAASAGKAPSLGSGKSWWQPEAPAVPVLELTDQQRREARLARRAEGRAANQATATRSEPSARQPNEVPAQASGNLQTPARPKLQQMLAYWLQLFLCVVVGYVMHSRLTSGLAILGVAILYYRRKLRWEWFFIIIAIAVLIGQLVR